MPLCGILKERNALRQLSNAYGEHFSGSTFFSSVRDADRKLDDAIDMRAVRDYAYRQRREAQKQKSRQSNEQARQKKYKSAGSVFSTLPADL